MTLTAPTRLKSSRLDEDGSTQNDKKKHITPDMVSQRFDVTRSTTHPNTPSKIKDGQSSLMAVQNRWHVDPIEDYKMSSNPRGLCVIINNINFDTLAPREGSHWDAFHFSKIFGDYLGFQVVFNKNLTGEKMKQCCLQVSASCKPKHDALVVILMSHGNESNGIFGVDSVEVDLNEILTMFDNRNCKAMIGKPKIFIVQACRGHKADYGVRMEKRQFDLPFFSQPESPPQSQQTQQSSSQLSFSPSPSRLQSSSQVLSSTLDYPDSSLINNSWNGPNDHESKQPTRTDFILCFSCLSGHVSVRNANKGSWFGRSLCEHLREYADTKHLMQILNMVSREIRNKTSDEGHKQALEITCISFDRNLYFNPGMKVTHAPALMPVQKKSNYTCMPPPSSNKISFIDSHRYSKKGVKACDKSVGLNASL